MNLAAAFAVTESSQVAEPRRTVTRLAGRLGFSEERAGRAALIATELGTNLAKHARAGEILIRALPGIDGSGEEGVEMIAIDRGPGMSDLNRSRQDGYSTTGSLGHGLGAMHRQADDFQIYTLPSGTVAVARLWREPRTRAGTGNVPAYQVGGVNVAKMGEDVSGDAWSFRLRGERLAIMLADGLGHGLHAHEAARQAVRVFEQAYARPPASVIEDVHAALRPTRGASVAMLAVDRQAGTANYCGLGNVAANILPAAGRRTALVSHNGTAGHSAARFQEFSYALPARAGVVMHTDGLGTHWDFSAYPGLLSRDPSLIAAVLYRDFSRQRDDVTVVVAREVG
jgi:anti-sigma regulatory factor (Ser/Thr protein kinase)